MVTPKKKPFFTQISLQHKDIVLESKYSTKSKNNHNNNNDLSLDIDEDDCLNINLEMTVTKEIKSITTEKQS